jgi:phosphoadenosine phosphosulfate reductase
MTALPVKHSPQAPDLTALNAQLTASDLEGRLLLIAQKHRKAVFTTSLGIEDQLITAMIASSSADIEIATLLTGRLFPQVEALLAETEARYGITITGYQPKEADVAAYASQYGMNGFYESVEARHACCHVRKLVPLDAALHGTDAWVTGLRRGQSGNRADTPFAEYDESRELIKYNPLADWDIDAIRAFVSANQVPINPLHARGFPSIGCEPCTRAIKPGESERAGRWWWENDNSRECGLHVASAAPSSAIPLASNQ